MSTLEQVAKKHNITLNQVRKLKSAIVITWDYLEYEYIDLFGGEDKAIKAHGSRAAMIAEATVDADRLRDHGDVDWFYDLGYDRLIDIAKDAYTAQGW